MSGKIVLPPQEFVAKWDEQKVVKWLKKVQLEDCIPAFENRRINGTKLLDLTEQKLFSFQDMKIKHRGQIAKCVNECKSQASNAKRIVGSIRQHKSKERSAIPAVDNGEYYDSDDDFDYWDSDFDEDFDDECNEENTHPIVSDVSNGTEVVSNGNNLSDVPRGTIDFSQVRFIPMPPDAPPLVNSINNNKPVQRHTIPRQPIKRPPSQPPPPPVTQPKEKQEKPLEEYEIPISASGSPQLLLTDADSTFSESPVVSRTASPAGETYEVIQTLEENYEIVESPPLPAKTTEKPVLPPRMLSPTSRSSQPPPLPQKPKKFQESNCSNDGFKLLNRSHIPQEETNGQESLTTNGIGTALLNSLLLRQNNQSASTASLPLRTTELNNDGCNGGNVSLKGSQSSLSSSPDKAGQFTVGGSSFTNNTSSQTGKSHQFHPSDIDEIAQSMATRPLPPVPQVSRDLSDTENDVTLHPWFHEMEREAAEQIIKDLYLDGSFLVRPSKRAGKDNPFTLTVLQDTRVFHLNIRQRPDGLFALGKRKIKEKSFESVPSLISYHQSESILLTSRGESAGQTILRAFPEKKFTAPPRKNDES